MQHGYLYSVVVLLICLYPVYYFQDIDKYFACVTCIYHTIVGSYKQLCCKLGEAEAQYKKAFAFDHSNIDVHLKLVMLLTEFGELKEVCVYMYMDMLLLYIHAIVFVCHTLYVYLHVILNYVYIKLFILLACMLYIYCMFVCMPCTVFLLLTCLCLYVCLIG